MSDWKSCRLSVNDTLRHALKIISDGSVQIGLVVDDSDKLIGIITDGDVRRELLKGATLDVQVADVVNRHPITGSYGADRQDLLQLMREKRVQNIPLIDDDNIIRDLLSVNDFVFTEKRDNIVLLMAGGLGMRLRPLTESCPKPLLKVGKKPILETILDSFIQSGFSNFYIAVNYKSSMIEEYFGDGTRFGVQIRYLHEDERMGTAGALYLLPEEANKPVIVMNGDLLTKVDFGEMLDKHLSSDAEATMAVREYQYNIPYGVIEFDGSHINGIKEKPQYDYYVNAGIYILNPSVVKIVSKKGYLDMPELFKRVIAYGGKVNGYLIRDYWMDVGRIDDFARAQEEYSSVFS